MLVVHTKIPSIVIETPRLLLKELNPEVMTLLHTTCTDDEIMQFLGLGAIEELMAEKHKFVLGLTMHKITFCNFVIILKDTGEVLGRCGFHTWYGEHSRAEMGYGIHDEANKQKGYMKEALVAMVHYGFAQLGLNRIEALVGSRNVPSLKLVNGLGFTQEGVLRQHYCKNGFIEDSVCFSLLKSEYHSGI